MISTVAAFQSFQMLRLVALIFSSIVLAKSTLSTAEIGQYELLLFVGTTLSFFWVNGFLQGMAPMYGKADEATQQKMIFNLFLLLTGCSAALFCLLVLGKKMMLPLLTGQNDIPHYHIFCLYWLLNLPSFCVEYFLMVKEKPLGLLAWGIGSALGQILAIGIPLWMGYGIGGSIACLCIFVFAKFLLTLALALRWGEIGLHIGLLRQTLLFSYPLIINVLIGNLVLFFDNWLVGWYYQNEATFAVYRYGSREFPIATALATALGTAMIPRMQANWQSGLAELKMRSSKLMQQVFPLTLLALLLSPSLFPLVFNPEFSQSAHLFNIYLLMTASRVLLPNSIVLAKGEARIIFYVGLLELAVKVLLGFWFIGQWGLMGLAWSAVLAFWVEKLGLIWYLEKKQGIATTQWLDLKQYLVWCALLMAVYFISVFWAV